MLMPWPATKRMVVSSGPGPVEKVLDLVADRVGIRFQHVVGADEPVDGSLLVRHLVQRLAVDQHQRLHRRIERRGLRGDDVQDAGGVVDRKAQIAGAPVAVVVQQRILLDADDDDEELALLRRGLLPAQRHHAALGEVAEVVGAGDADRVLALLDRHLDDRLPVAATDRAGDEVADIAAVGQDGEVRDIGVGLRGAVDLDPNEAVAHARLVLPPA